MAKKTNKVSIIGAGNVGATCAFALLTSGLASDLVLVDMNRERVLGEVMDLAHGLSFVRPMDVAAGEMEDTAQSDVVVIAAGASQKPGETRMDLLRKNAGIIDSISRDAARYSPEAIILVVTNPVDVLTKVALEASGFPPERVIGSGTVLDTARLRYLLSQHTNIDLRNIHTHVIGEHGDSEVALFSTTTIAGMTLKEYCDACRMCDGPLDEIVQEQIRRDVRDAGYHIIDKKGSTYYAVALAVRRIVEAILRDENSILTVSTLLTGEHGISGVCLSLPTIVGAGGAMRKLTITLSEREMEGLAHSAKVIAEAGESIRQKASV